MDQPRVLWTPAFVRLGLSEFSYFVSYGVLLYSLPLYLVSPVRADERAVGLIYAGFTVAALALRPLAGRVTDRIGPRPVMALGGGLATVAALGLLAVDSVPGVLAVRVLAGVAEAAFMVAGMVALAGLAPPQRLGEAVSYNSLALYLGIAVGPLCGEAVRNTVGFAGTWWAAASLAAVSAALAMTLPGAQPAVPDTRGRNGAWIHRASLAPSLAFVGGSVAGSGVLAFAVLRVGELGMMGSSLPLVAYGGAVVTIRLLLPRIADQHPPLSIMAISLFITTTGAVLAAIAAAWPVFIVGAGLLGAGVALLTPAFFAAVFAGARPQDRGSASATATMAIDLGMGGGPIAAGLIAVSWGLPAAFAAISALTLLCSLWATHLAVRHPASSATRRSGLSL